MTIDPQITATSLTSAITRVFELASKKIRAIESTWDPSKGAPVFTVEGKYATRGWTEWTQGFQYGCALLAFDATDDRELFELGRRNTIERMAPHITHTGVHDHGFNNLSTYGNLRRLMRDNRISHNQWEMDFYEMAIKASAGVQASRWSQTPGTFGFIYSFNGPHSLFVDTMRTLRILAVAHQLKHVLMAEADVKIGFLGRLIQHAATTAKFIIYHGDSDEVYDVRGRTAHEAIFNTNNGDFRCRSTQQGYSPFSTWTRGLAWAILGFAEQLEFLKANGDPSEGRWNGILQKAALATADHYIDDCTATDGIPYWDDGAPGLAKMSDWRTKAADPFNDYEPVDSSAAAIAAQGLIRLGRFLGLPGEKYTRAGLTIAKTLFAEPYLSTNSNHQGVLLHSVYHRPNNWDHIPAGRKIPCNESSMWGDYHALELALTIQRIAAGGRYYTFFD